MAVTNKALERYSRNKSGESIEAIAKADKVNEQTVKDCIRAVEMYRTRNTHEYVNESLSEVVIAAKEPMKAAIIEGLTATNEFEKDGIIVSEPDHSTRFKAVAEVRQIAAVVQPKGGGPSVHVGVGVGIAAQRVASGPYIGYEERLRQIQQQRQDAPVLEGSTVTMSNLELPSGEFSENNDEEAEA